MNVSNCMIYQLWVNHDRVCTGFEQNLLLITLNSFKLIVTMRLGICEVDV